MAVDPASPNVLVKNATFTVHAVSDTEFETPLAAYDVSGNTISLSSNSEGLLPEFGVDDVKKVRVKSGAYSVPVASFESVAAAAEAAADAAEQSAQSAAAAAASAGEQGASDAVIAGLVSDVESDTHAAVVDVVGAKLVVLPSGSDTSEVPDGAVVVFYDADGEPVVLAEDSFNRTVSGGWGSADIGGSYIYSSPENFSVNPTDGGVLANAPGTTREARLLTPSILDGEMEFAVGYVGDHPDAVAQQDLYMRAAGYGDRGYGVRVFYSSGDNNVSCALLVNGATLGNFHTTSVTNNVPGDLVRGKLRVTGSNPTQVQAKLWADGDEEPLEWDASEQDSTATYQDAGGVIVSAYMGSATTATYHFRVKSFQVTEVTA